MRPPLSPEMVAHCLLVERPNSLLLVDTGYGTDDLADPGRLGQPFRTLVRPVLDPAETAVAQVRALGHDPADVRDIVLTHLDLDHAGGLADFPRARVHVHATELQAATHPSLRERTRYVPAQWAHRPQWVEHREQGEGWFGFEAIKPLGDDVLLVPLQGHTRGHSGVALPRPGGGWLLHAGDAYFAAGDKERPRRCPATLKAFQRMMAVDDGARRSNLERLQEVHARHGTEVTVFCAHSGEELEALRNG